MKYIIIYMIIITILVLYVLTTYNKLVKKRNEILNNFNVLYDLISARFVLTKSFLEETKNNLEPNNYKILYDLVDKFEFSNRTECFTYNHNLYNQLEAAIVYLKNSNYTSPNFETIKNNLNENNLKISEIRVKYNEAVMRLNTAIEFPLTAIVAAPFKFEKCALFPEDK